MTNPLRGLTIGTRLLLIVLVMMLLTLTSSFLLYSHFEVALLDEIQGQTESLSKALQISVQQLTSRGESDDKLLNDYVQRLSSKGVKEISILSNEKQVVASSNLSKIGRTLGSGRLARRGDNVIITGTLADDDTDFEGKKTYTLDIPIIVDNEKRGYVRLHLLLDDFRQIIHEGLNRRLLATALVFVLGMAGVVILSYGVTRALDQLAKAAGRVADGDLTGRITTRRTDEVGRLVATFNTMVEKLGEQRALESRLRRAERASAVANLASAVAHEIRNPLNLISLSVDHLGLEFGPSDPGRAEEHARIIASVRDELARLNRMVGDFLNYGRPRRLAPRACRIEEALEEVLSLIAAKARDQQIEIFSRIPDDLPVIQADPEGLRTCFLNVVINALQATPPGGSLTIEARAHQDGAEGSAVSVVFRDT
ncbi:MAG TPA: HAMP domain-containing protein, partial [Candidatus Polarisedimenticolia bacterium]|nr:HAMP domain-containing protein [Candidatus Polarisedimenticolia bacterium]